MLERLERLPIDPILGLMGLFRADTDPRRVDLGVGVYRDDQGHTPVLACVRRAEQTVLSRQATKSYVGPAGNIGFNQAMARLVELPEYRHARTVMWYLDCRSELRTRYALPDALHSEQRIVESCDRDRQCLGELRSEELFHALFVANSQNLCRFAVCHRLEGKAGG